VLELVDPPFDLDRRILHVDPLLCLLEVKHILALALSLFLAMAWTNDESTDESSDAADEMDNAGARMVVESFTLGALVSQPAASPAPADNDRVDEARHES